MVREWAVAMLIDNLSHDDLQMLARYAGDEPVDPKRLRGDRAAVQRRIRDRRFSDRLLADRDDVLAVSPYLFFLTMLVREREDLATRAWSYELATSRMSIIFDTPQLIALLDDEGLLDYLALMLASFIRVNQYSRLMEVRRGIFRRMRLNTLDIESMLEYSRYVGESERFVLFKRVADVCLFMNGIYGERLRFDRVTGRHFRPPTRGRASAKDYRECGRHYYREAARIAERRDVEDQDVLLELSHSFELATRSLGFLSDHYLATLRSRGFSL